MTFDSTDALAHASSSLEAKTPTEILEHAFAEHGPRIAVSTAFGVDGCALIHMALQIDPRVRVFTVDTDFLFDETYDLIERFVDRYDLNLEIIKSELSVQDQAAQYGPDLYDRDSDLCCHLRKVVPTRRMLAGLDGWVAALRRDQSASRAGIQILEPYTKDDGTTLIKIHPLANWSRTDVWRYVLANDVPYNPLLDAHYESIGCRPCTQPVKLGDAERSGRWGGRKQECGIHTETLRRAAQ
ncbi:MAG TPA: phosphoadenylyl-sulfate reductase [Kofleriaceae bacterium]|nr:phosphoadenylyl-sulfate reductase [Kofleriaceae bacterium]